MDKRADHFLRQGVRHLLTMGVAAAGLLMAFGLVYRGDAGAAAMRAGIIVMICTPVLRVAWLAIGFAWERDWRFFFVSMGVLAMLIVGAVVRPLGH